MDNRSFRHLTVGICVYFLYLFPAPLLNNLSYHRTNDAILFVLVDTSVSKDLNNCLIHSRNNI